MMASLNRGMRRCSGRTVFGRVRKFLELGAWIDSSSLCSFSVLFRSLLRAGLTNLAGLGIPWLSAVSSAFLIPRTWSSVWLG